jgi:hypothetical protein
MHRPNPRFDTEPFTASLRAAASGRSSGLRTLQVAQGSKEAHSRTEDIKHCCRVVTALAKTIDIQAEIDELFARVEKDVLTLPNNMSA